MFYSKRSHSGPSIGHNIIVDLSTKGPK